MEPKHLISSAALSGALVTLLLNPDFAAAIAFAAACALFGFLHFIDRRRANELEEIQKQLEVFKNRIDGLAIGRSMGR